MYRCRPLLVGKMLGAEKHLSSAEMLPNTDGVCVCKEMSVLYIH